MHMPYQVPMRSWLISVQMPETRSDSDTDREWSQLDINFIIQKNKYKIQNLKSILPSK